MILVAGATGTLGTRVVRLLRDRGEAVRVLARDPARGGQLPGTVQLLTGDVRDPATLAASATFPCPCCGPCRCWPARWPRCSPARRRRRW
jgi:nucleoside-diphosphate-sugar epimerase